MAIKFVLKQNLPKPQSADKQAFGEYIFDENMFTVGSDAANNLVLAESAPEQAVIVRDEEHLTLINSAKGTRLNGENLRPESISPLRHGDEIRIGNYIISVVDDETDLPPREKTEQAITGFNGSSNLNGRAKNIAAENEISPLPEDAKQTENSLEEMSPTRNFAEILDTLRTEEDSFYFIVKAENRETARVMLEHAETPIGANDKGKINFAVGQISTLYAVARKDWSGILLESKRRNSVFVNDEKVETARRLRNDDRVSFVAPTKCSLILHEPSSLVALESILSARVASNGATRFGGLAANNAGATENALPVAIENASLLERKYFGYFSFIEIVTMFIGTLIGAVLFFLFFEFM
ncbi:MAG: FHA domain-containing protein, partial [Pyrinomonadaceae bacterium]